jgi:hypothetical protein
MPLGRNTISRSLRAKQASIRVKVWKKVGKCEFSASVNFAPKHFEACVRNLAVRFIAKDPLRGWRQFDRIIYRPEISHPLHVAGRSNEELHKLKIIAKRIFQKESPVRSNDTPGPPRRRKEVGGLPEKLYTKT